MVLVDQPFADRPAQQTAGDQAIGGGSDGNGRRAGDAEIFGERSEGSGRAVPAFERDGPGHDAEGGMDAEQLGQRRARAVLDDGEDPAEDQIDDQRLAAALEQRQTAADADGGEECQHHRRLQRRGEPDAGAAVVVQDKGENGHEQAADDRRGNAEGLEEAQAAAQPVADDEQQHRDGRGPQRVKLNGQNVLGETPRH